MKFTLFLVPLFLVPLFLVVQFLQAQNFNSTNVPDWVKSIEIPKSSELSKYDISSGYYSILDDNQVNLTEYAVFKRTVLNVLSYSGITNASQLSVTLDTNYQDLNIHYLNVWRDGKKIDRTSDLSFEIINNEFQLNQGIYSGQITAYEILDDIRKGDLIEFDYSINGQNPIFENENYLMFPLEKIIHVDLLSYIVIYPQNRDYSIKFSDSIAVPYTDTVFNKMHLIEIAIKNVKPLQLEENMPSWEIPYNYFSLSSMKTWKEVNFWAQRVFSLEQEPDLELVFEEIFEGDESMPEKINKIIDYVQDDIRYMGIESGIGSIKPFSPEQVVKQRFGDCKDKSLLLVWLLKKIGVEEAFPVLVNVFSLYEVDKFLPSNQVFNHCITKYKYQDSIYWVDPTITHQGGRYDNLYTPDYGKVLVIGEPLDSLPNMIESKINKGIVEIENVITIPSLSEPANLKISSKFYGFYADLRRSILEQYPLERISKSEEDNLKLVYPVVERNSEIEVTDSVESNVLTLEYSYLINNFILDSKEVFSLEGYSVFKYEPHILYSYFDESACIDRDYNYFLDDSKEIILRAIIEFPKEMLIDDFYEIIEHEAYFSEKTIEQLGPKTIKMEFSYKNLVKLVLAEDYKDFCEERKKLVDSFISIFYFPN